MTLLLLISTIIVQYSLRFIIRVSTILKQIHIFYMKIYRYLILTLYKT